MQRRAASRSPADVLAHYERDPFCAPAIVDLRESLAVDGHLLAAAEGFEALGLSPVAPLGVTSAVANTSQNRVLSALRMMEVVSDSTNVLALECARRLRGKWDTPVHLATCHRVLRAQPVPRLPGHSQHFSLFALASGGREAKDHAFTVDTLVLHIRTMLRALERLEQHGYAFGARRVDHPRDVRADEPSAIELPRRSTSDGAEASGACLLLGWTALSDLGYRTRWRRGSADRRRRLRLADQARRQPSCGVHRDRRRRPADCFALSQGADATAGREVVEILSSLPTPRIGRMGYNPANFAYHIGTGPWARGYAVYYAVSFYDATTGRESARSALVGTEDGSQAVVWRFRFDPDPHRPDGSGDGSPNLETVRGTARAVDPRDPGQCHDEVPGRCALSSGDSEVTEATEAPDFKTEQRSQRSERRETVPSMSETRFARRASIEGSGNPSGLEPVRPLVFPDPSIEHTAKRRPRQGGLPPFTPLASLLRFEIRCLRKLRLLERCPV